MTFSDEQIEKITRDELRTWKGEEFANLSDAQLNFLLSKEFERNALYNVVSEEDKEKYSKKTVDELNNRKNNITLDLNSYYPRQLSELEDSATPDQQRSFKEINLKLMLGMESEYTKDSVEDKYQVVAKEVMGLFNEKNLLEKIIEDRKKFTTEEKKRDEIPSVKISSKIGRDSGVDAAANGSNGRESVLTINEEYSSSDSESKAASPKSRLSTIIEGENESVSSITSFTAESSSDSDINVDQGVPINLLKMLRESLNSNPEKANDKKEFLGNLNSVIEKHESEVGGENESEGSVEKELDENFETATLEEAQRPKSKIGQLDSAEDITNKYLNRALKAKIGAYTTEIKRKDNEAVSKLDGKDNSGKSGGKPLP